MTTTPDNPTDDPRIEAFTQWYEQNNIATHIDNPAITPQFWTSDDPTNPLRNPAHFDAWCEKYHANRSAPEAFLMFMQQWVELHRQSDEQHMADVAASALAILNKLEYDLRELGCWLKLLADWTADHEPDAVCECEYHLTSGWTRHDLFRQAVQATVVLGHCVPEVVRDIAADLPIRGLDYDAEVSQ